MVASENIDYLTGISFQLYLFSEKKSLQICTGQLETHLIESFLSFCYPPTFFLNGV